MLDVNLEQFWKDDETAHLDNCFSSGAPQAALGIRMSEECVYAELGEEGNPFETPPTARRIELNKRYNEKARKIVGISLLPEEFPPEGASFPPVKGIADLFESRTVHSAGSDWLERSCSSPGELESLLNRVDKRLADLHDFVYPADWESEKKRIFEQFGQKPWPQNSVRGPVTFAMSVFGPENLIYLILDEPELAGRFSQTIGDALCTLIDLTSEEAGHGIDGFMFFDDDCCLLTPEMYEFFGYPILKRVFGRYCPKEENFRYQHSDSAMGHLLPILSRLNLTACNFGPTVLPDSIRKYMPRTRIDGSLAPFTFMNNDEEKIIAEVKRDCEMTRLTRGLNISTAGSINNGSLLTSMRAVMYAIQNYGRY